MYDEVFSPPLATALLSWWVVNSYSTSWSRAFNRGRAAASELL